MTKFLAFVLNGPVSEKSQIAFPNNHVYLTSVSMEPDATNFGGNGQNSKT